MLRVALFGAGRIGQVHARSIAESGDAQLAWVCDPIEAAATALASSHGSRASVEPQDALEDPSVDAVLIASSTPTHVDLIRRSVLAGKKVLCEKPIDLDMEAIDQCWRDIAGHAPFVMLGFNRRFDPSFREVRERVAAGEIGPIRALRVISRDPAPPPAAYLGVSGGMFRDMTIHDFDMARFQLGEIVEVQAMASTNGEAMFEAANDHAQAIVVMRAASGALCTIVNSRSCAFGYDQRLEAFGDLGSLEAGNLTATTVRAFTAETTEAAGPALNFFLERYMPAYKAEFAEFVAAIKEDRAPSVGFADGRAALVLAEAAVESVATGRTVPIPGA
ncbi:MAG: inositol 2-dehydrogenase [Chloroflexi bacterium]|nr:inositol 2-dehydrogenase [Chloroflexota bacterium]